MNVLILEDEQIAADKLERQLKALDPSIVVMDKLDSIQKAVVWLTNHEADVLFCDIHLADGLSFRIFDQVEVKTPIIFTTAYDQYALQAFKVNSIDYLLKPIGKYDLAAAWDKFRELRSDMNAGLDFSALMDAMKNQQAPFQKRFMVYVGEHIRTVDVEDVAYFYAEGKYVFLITQEGKEYNVDFTLDRLTQSLNPDDFFRVNRQFIVHLQGIGKMFTWTKGRVKLELNPASSKDVVVSVERAANFKLWLNR